jgi:hypothetical protein
LDVKKNLFRVKTSKYGVDMKTETIKEKITNWKILLRDSPRPQQKE